jgi:hypothetical protein
MVSPFNWTSLAHRSENGNNVNTQSNYVGFRISSDGGLSFGGGSSGTAFGNSGGIDNIMLGGSSNGVDRGVSGDGNFSGSGMGSGVGGSGHEWFFGGEGSGHGSSRPDNK